MSWPSDKQPLQYKWAAQLSAATEVRIGSNLRSLMTRWQRDLYDELSAVCVALQVGPDSGAHDTWNDYLQRYAEWNGVGTNSEVAEGAYPNPDLVREIYDWQTSAQGKPELLRLNPNTKTLDSVGAPQELETLLARLRANAANVGVAKRAWEYGSLPENESGPRSNQLRAAGTRTDALAGWQLDEAIPALVHPVVHHANPLNSETPIDRTAMDWLVVVLNLRVIQDRILPELASRHFWGPDGLDANRGRPLDKSSGSSSRQNFQHQNVSQGAASRVRENSPRNPLQLGNTSRRNPPRERNSVDVPRAYSKRF